MSRARLLVVGLAGATVLLAGCGGGSSGTASGEPDGAGSPAPVTEGPDGVQVVDVTGTAQIRFDPARIAVHTGKVRVNFTVPKGSAPHSFTLADLGVDTGVFSAATKTAAFTVSKPGHYTYTCTIHSQMTGTLDVTER